MENSVEIQKAIKKYLNCDMLDSALLGNGANGKVYKCKICHFWETESLK